MNIFSEFAEMVRAATGQENTSHNLYFVNPVFFQGQAYDKNKLIDPTTVNVGKYDKK